MAVNILGGRLNVVHARITIPITDTIVSAANTAVIYLMDGDPLSYRADRAIKPFDQFVEGKGYNFYALEDMDMEDVFYPPFPTGGSTGGGVVIIGEEGDQIIEE